MWDRLPSENKTEYKRMMLAFASLTEMFSQKSDGEEMPAPIINTKYQETMFRETFHALIEDIGNTSYDASVNLIGSDGSELKCLVGIKTFGIGSGSQKVAQFKSEHGSLTDLINAIKENSYNENGKPKSKEEIDILNHDYYMQIAKIIAGLRNDRIRSSKENIRGFKISDAENDIESVYHVLMPSRKGDGPKIYVGETSYDEISVPDIEILGCTKASSPLNFSFTDGNHEYKFTEADSQLYMDFHNEEIIKEVWDVIYATDPYEIFSKIADEVYGRCDIDYESGREYEVAAEQISSYGPKITEQYYWPLLNSNGEAELFSGFNAFYGVGSKMGKEQRGKAVDKVRADYENIIDKNILDAVIAEMKDFLCTPTSPSDRLLKVEERKHITDLADTSGNTEFSERVKKLLFRPMDEMYIPIPNSREFHKQHPDFFAPKAGSLTKGTNKLALPKEKRAFNLVFEPSGQSIRAYISQDSGKAIESFEKQTYLGDWILRGIFQLDEYEPLTAERMEQININAICIYRTDADDNVHIRFTWMDK